MKKLKTDASSLQSCVTSSVLTIGDFAMYLPHKTEVQYTDCLSDRTRTAYLTGLTTIDIETTYKRKINGCSGDLISFKGNNNIQDLNVKLRLFPLSWYEKFDEIVLEMSNYDISMVNENPDLVNRLPNDVIKKMLKYHIDINGLIPKGLAVVKTNAI